MSETSVSQQNFLQKKRQHKRIVHSSRFLILILFLGIWEFTASKGFIDPLFSAVRQKWQPVFGLWSVIKVFFCTSQSHFTRHLSAFFSSFCAVFL